MTKLNLVVIRSADIEQSMTFYSALGLRFEQQKHGAGPRHFAAESDSCVFEIYPLSERDSPTTSVRLGFRVQDLAATLKSLGLDPSPLMRVVVSDPDGHRIELTQGDSLQL